MSDRLSFVIIKNTVPETICKELPRKVKQIHTDLNVTSLENLLKRHESHVSINEQLHVKYTAAPVEYHGDYFICIFLQNTSETLCIVTCF